MFSSDHLQHNISLATLYF